MLGDRGGVFEVTVRRLIPSVLLDLDCRMEGLKVLGMEEDEMLLLSLSLVSACVSESTASVLEILRKGLRGGEVGESFCDVKPVS